MPIALVGGWTRVHAAHARIVACTYSLTLAISDTRVALDIVMLKRFWFIKQSLVRMVMNDNVGASIACEEKTY